MTTSPGFLPRLLRIEDYIQARSAEVNELLTTLQTKTFSRTKRVFQLLPKYLRRRAQSHNLYRTPARIREIHKRQVRVYFYFWLSYLPSRSKMTLSPKYRSTTVVSVAL